jgi:pimeloyl-ACP methyl ester carboxylesterase
MHQTSDLPTYLQDLVDYEDYSSLNISLSLGMDDRQNFIDCETTPIIAGTHEQSVDELKLWFDWLASQGHKRFILVAHSRGGAQASLFWHTFKYKGLEQLVLIAPATHDQTRVSASYENRYSKPLAPKLAFFKAMENKTDALTETAILYCIFANVSAEAFLSYYSPFPNKHTPDLLKDIGIPTTVFLGTEDYLSDRFMEYADEFSENNLVKTHWIDGADHFFRDLYADEIIEEVIYDMD